MILCKVSLLPRTEGLTDRVVEMELEGTGEEEGRGKSRRLFKVDRELGGRVCGMDSQG